MQKVKLTFTTPTAVIENGKAVVKYETETADYIVASTKSYNNLVDDLKLQGKVATNAVVTDLFLDKTSTSKIIADCVKEQIKDTEIAQFITEHCLKALDGACVFKKPPVIRKK
jgi:hypothetical protein